MASITALPEQQKVGGAKQQKNGQANRRVLRDIGNLVIASVVVERKCQNQINRPVTRSYRAQLLANAQDALVKENCIRKPLAKEGNVLMVKEAAAAKVTKQEPVKLKNESVIDTSSEEGSLRKPVKTLTSTLTARSKAACGLAKKPKKLKIKDIDAPDVDNELAAVEYVEDIYSFYKLTEDNGRASDYIGSQPDINSKMRAILVDWLLEVHKRFQLTPETLYLTVNIVDRFLSLKKVTRKELQLLGISSMLIACKYEEIWAPEVSNFITISDNTYFREDILVMEKAILGALEWYLTVPTPYVFLVRYVKASIPADKEMENMAFFFGELGLMSYSTIVKYGPSMLAAASVYAARCTLNRIPFWTETLKHHTGFNDYQIIDCAKILVSSHSGMGENKLKAVSRKYSSQDKAAVALFPAAKGFLLEDHDMSQ